VWLNFAFEVFEILQSKNLDFFLNIRSASGYETQSCLTFPKNIHYRQLGSNGPSRGEKGGGGGDMAIVKKQT
jgi:hypothetical protein